MTKKDFEDWKMANSSLIEDLRKAAWKLHEGVNQTYDGTKPYGVHLDMVVEAVLEFAYQVCDDEKDLPPLIFGAYYHDSIEDARLTYNDVKRTANEWMNNEQAHTAAEIVYALTNDKGRNRAERAGERYYQGIRETPYAPFVKLADRLANITYSCQSSEKANQHMREVYLQELPHFLASIDAHSSDVRLALPEEMIARIHRQLQDEK